MPFRLFDEPAVEPSRFVAFAGSSIDRQSEQRSEASVADALSHPAARVLLVRDGRAWLDLGGPTARGLHPLPEARALGFDEDTLVLLGVHEQGPVLAALGAAEAELPETVKAIEYRSVYVQGLLGAEDQGALAQGVSLLAWHANHRFCGRCGAATAMRAGGYRRQCTACQAEHFPRTDPVAIMLTVTRDRCLLGRGRHFAAGMFSALAGFIEPGETIEAAVRRETLEESGIRVGRVAYHASQPWPFPYSLMIGCHAEALTEEIDPDLDELEACRWFSRDEVLAMIDRRHPDGLTVPPQGAIAHHLIRSWAESA